MPSEEKFVEARRLGEPTFEFQREEHTAVKVIGGLLSLAGATTGAYHGYKRNNSVGCLIG